MNFVLIELVGLAILLVIWLATGPFRLKKRILVYLSPKIISIVSFLIVLVTLQVLTSSFLSWPVTSYDSLVSFLGFCIFIFGFVIAVWAKLTMRRNWGVPGQHDFQRQKKLITWGPFGFSRHPIYLGLTLVFMAFSVTLRSYLIFLNLIIIWRFYRASIIEEKLLTRHFGRSYLAYKGKVSRFIFYKQ